MKRAFKQACLLVAEQAREIEKLTEERLRLDRDCTSMLETNRRHTQEYNALKQRTTEEAHDDALEREKLRRENERLTAGLELWRSNKILDEINESRLRIVALTEEGGKLQEICNRQAIELLQWRSGKRLAVSPVSQPVSDEDKELIR